MDNRPLSKMAAENSNVMLCHVPLIVSLGYLWRRQQGSTGIENTIKNVQPFIGHISWKYDFTSYTKYGKRKLNRFAKNDRAVF